MSSCTICRQTATVYCHNDGSHLYSGCDLLEHARPLLARHDRTPLPCTSAFATSPTLSDEDSWDTAFVASVPQFHPSLDSGGSLLPPGVSNRSEALAFGSFDMVEPIYELDSLLADLDSPTNGWSWDKQTPDPVAKAKVNVQMVDGAQKHQFSAACAEDPQTKPPPSRTPEAVDSAPAPLTRRDRVERYIAKRCRRKFDKVVRYPCRKVYADARPRIKGRFVKPEELETYYRGAGAGKGST